MTYDTPFLYTVIREDDLHLSKNLTANPFIRLDNETFGMVRISSDIHIHC